jgi:hypothetical protein
MWSGKPEDQRELSTEDEGREIEAQCIADVINLHRLESPMW